MKRANGTGSIYKLSGKRRKPWRVRITAGWDDEGNQQYKELGTYTTKRAAELALGQELNHPTEQRGITLGELYEQWSKFKFSQTTKMTGNTRKTISKSTVDNYKAAWLRLEPHKAKRFESLRTAFLQEIINNEIASGKSHSSLQKIKLLMTSLYDYALENDIIHKNYATYVKLPEKGDSTKTAFTADEVAAILSAAENNDILKIIAILCYTGFRLEELLTVARDNVHIEDGYIVGGLKTEAGTDRIVPIHAKILPFVRYFHDKANNWLITRPDGERYKQAHYRDMQKAALKEIGVRPLLPHECRHTCATMLVQSGANPAMIQAIMGHEKFDTTLGYTHLNVNDLKKAMDNL